MSRSEIINSISSRIKKEYCKHKNIEGWEKIAAVKIFENHKSDLESFNFKNIEIVEAIYKHIGGLISAALGVFFWTFDKSNIYNWIALYVLGYFILGVTFDLSKIILFKWLKNVKRVK